MTLNNGGNRPSLAISEDIMAKVWTALDYATAYSYYDLAWVSKLQDWGYFKSILTKAFSKSLFTPASWVLFVGIGHGYWFNFLATVPGAND